MSPEAKELLEEMVEALNDPRHFNPLSPKETVTDALRAALRVLRDLPEFDRSAPEVLDHVAWRIFDLLNELTEPTP